MVKLGTAYLESYEGRERCETIDVYDCHGWRMFLLQDGSTGVHFSFTALERSAIVQYCS
jgi:hypothetical protein